MALHSTHRIRYPRIMVKTSRVRSSPTVVKSHKRSLLLATSFQLTLEPIGVATIPTSARCNISEQYYVSALSAQLHVRPVENHARYELRRILLYARSYSGWSCCITITLIYSTSLAVLHLEDCRPLQTQHQIVPMVLAYAKHGSSPA